MGRGWGWDAGQRNMACAGAGRLQLGVESRDRPAALAHKLCLAAHRAPRLPEQPPPWQRSTRRQPPRRLPRSLTARVAHRLLHCCAKRRTAAW